MVDREAAEEMIQAFPGIVAGVRMNRAFLGRAIHYLAAESGIRQFLDIGTGGGPGSWWTPGRTWPPTAASDSGPDRPPSRRPPSRWLERSSVTAFRAAGVARRSQP
jgi:hypothetical protein